MPSIDVAMARSLRGGVWGSVMSSMAATIEKRQIMSTVENVGNQSQAPMNANSNVPPFLQNQPTHTAHSTAPAPVASGASAPPQYAEFDVSKSGGKEDGDALPAMPSWEGAGSKKVAVEEEVE
ncbi:fibroin-3-like protein [Colletotrichum kahawae]|uniref:Fibroin-3-like protein n=1 Tax=Colletotrichum kahawae TaxID=34407 RepID=A0AAD9YJ64_COLKA|nr:fibroin-3-like protein [Colletotrichum kahawae]